MWLQGWIRATDSLPRKSLTRCREARNTTVLSNAQIFWIGMWLWCLLRDVPRLLLLPTPLCAVDCGEEFHGTICLAQGEAAMVVVSLHSTSGKQSPAGEPSPAGKWQWESQQPVRHGSRTKGKISCFLITNCISLIKLLILAKNLQNKHNKKSLNHGNKISLSRGMILMLFLERGETTEKRKTKTNPKTCWNSVESEN